MDKKCVFNPQTDCQVQHSLEFSLNFYATIPDTLILAMFCRSCGNKTGR